MAATVTLLAALRQIWNRKRERRDHFFDERNNGKWLKSAILFFRASCHPEPAWVRDLHQYKRVNTTKKKDSVPSVA
jgi:hypothetical protein